MGAMEDAQAAAETLGQRLHGIAWPIASDGDGSLPWVERDDEAGVYDDDIEAAYALAAKLGGDARVMFAPVHDDPADADMLIGLWSKRAPRMHPFVLAPSEAERESYTAEQNDDGEWFCTGCGTNTFRYEESVIATREQCSNNHNGLTFFGSSDESGWDDDPGVVCDNGHIITTTIGVEFA